MGEENFAERRGKEGTLDKIRQTFHKLSLAITFKYFVQESFQITNAAIVYSLWLFKILITKVLVDSL